MKNKKSLAISLIIIMLCAVIACTFAFAFYKKSYNGWEQNISATSVVFKLNGNTVETVTNYDLGLIARGKEVEVDFEVAVKANSSRGSIAKFVLDLTFSGNDNELAKAIEVYYYENGQYNFVEMLSTMRAIEGFLPINTEMNYHYKFVYSPSASDYFENKSFNLKVVATSSIYKGETDMHFVSSFQSLKNTVDIEDTIAGKTLVMTSDITIPLDYLEDIIFNVPVNIDLAGHTFNLNSKNLIINANDNIKHTITNSSPLTGGIVGTGKIIYNLSTNDEDKNLVVIDDKLSSFFDYITVNNLNFEAVAFDMQNQINTYAEKILIKGQTLDFTKNLKYYFTNSYGADKYSIIPPMIGELEDTSVVTKTDSTATAFIVSNSYATPLTALNKINFALFYQLNSTVINANLNIRGVSKQAVVDYYLAKIPDEISGSVYFDGFDQATSSTITYITSSNKLSCYGIYLEDGFESIASWADDEMEIGVIIDTQGEQARGSKTVIVRMFNAKERTDKIYGYQQIILNEIGSIVNIYEEFIDKDLAQKAELYAINATFVNSAQNLNNVSLPYLSLTSVDNMAEFEVLRKPNGDKAVNIEIEFSFVYKNGKISGVQQYVTTTVTKIITVVGYTSSTELSDPTRSLQQNFDLNAYINKQGYEFLVKAFTKHGAKVDYEVGEEFQQYIYAENDIYIANSSGNFALVDDNYIYFDTTYILVGDEYVIDLNGIYILYENTYIDISSQKSNSGIYQRYTKITILPSKVPTKDITMADIYAYVWGEKIGGVKQYFTLDGVRISYNMKLPIYGIYHNTVEEIEDYKIYNILLQYFDSNLDGYIDYEEARVTWVDGSTQKLAKSLTTASLSGKTYYYINFSNLGITSIKGLEYFTNAIGFNFLNNEITTLSSIKNLYKLQYLELSNNKVADLEDLAYLDNLEILYLQNSPISSIEPIKYLPSMRRLDLLNNENISTFEYLVDYKNLTYLNITQASRKASTSYDTSYYLSLIYDNNRANGIAIRRDGNFDWVVTDTEIVAAKVLSELIVMDEAYTSLNIPNHYKYKYKVGSNTYTKEYNIRWETQLADYAYLQFNTVNGKTVSYTVVSPIVNRIIPITVSVTEVGSELAVAVTRKFNIKLLQSQLESDAIYIETTPGVFSLAKSVVPDTALLNFLVSIANNIKTGFVPLRNSSGTLIGGDTTYLEAKTISYAELHTADINDHSDALRNANINSLSGLSYFKDVVYFPLDLRGNEFSNADLTELSVMVHCDTIKLGGQAYDFSQISSYKEVDSVPQVTGLTNLKKLYVYGSYGLNSEEMLSKLYQVYLANPSVVIYKDSDTVAWNPYLLPMQKFSQSLPSGFAFIDINQEANYYESGNAYIVNFYNVKNVSLTIDFSDGNLVGNAKNLFEHTLTGVKYTKLSGYSDVVYDMISLYGNDGRGNISTDKYIQLIIDFNDKIKVIDYPLSGSYLSLNKVFPGRDLRSNVLDALTTLFNEEQSAASIATIGNKYYLENGYYYIKMATLANLSFASTVTIDGTYFDSDGDSAIKGLEYTSISSLKISRDCNLGDGKYISNLSELIIGYSGVDFSLIKTNLPLLTTLRLGLTTGVVGSSTEPNRYTVLYDASQVTPYYSLQHFINLSEFVAIDSNIFDWKGLNGLININLTKFYIYGSVNNFTNKNNNYASTEVIVRNIYNGSNVVTKDFRIGILGDSNDYTNVYTSSGWQDANSGVTALNYDYVKEYKEFATGIKSLGVKLNGIKHEYTENQSVNNGEKIILPTSTFLQYYGTTFASSDPLQRRFAISWKVVGIDKPLLSAIFGITVSDTSYMTETYFTNIPFCTLPRPVGNADREITVSAKAYDTYFILQGTLGSGYIDNDNNFVSFGGAVNTYTFAYPVLIYGTDKSTYQAKVDYRNGTDPTDVRASVNGAHFYNIVDGAITKTYLSYAAFADPNLRYEMFIILAMQLHNTSGTYALLGIIFYNATNTTTTLLAGGYRMYRLTITTTTIRAYWQNAAGDTSVGSNVILNFNIFGDNLNLVYISSLDGLEYFKNIYNLVVSTNLVCDVKALSGTAGWENRRIRFTAVANQIATVANSCGLSSLTLNDNIIIDVSCLKDLAKLSVVTLTGNMIQTLNYNGTSVFASSINTITNITVNGNYQIGEADIAALKSAIVSNGATTLNTLNIETTRCVGSKQVLLDVGVMSNYTASLKLILNGSGTNGTIVTQSDVNAFFADIAADTDPSGTGMANYTTTGFQLGTNFSLTRTVNGNGYTLTLRNRPNLINADGTPLAKMYYKLAQTTTDLLIRKTATAYAVNYEINLIDISGSNPTVLPFRLYNDPNRLLKQSDFDPALWIFMMSSATNSGTYYNYSPAATLNFTTEMGMRSLKGMELFTNTTTLRVDNQMYLNDLWAGQFNSLTSFRLGKTAITAQGLTGLRFAPNLTVLNLNESEGIDFLATVTYQDGGTVTTSIGKLILNKLKNLQEFYIDNQLNLDVYGGASGYQYLNKHMDGDNYLFNLTAAEVGSDARKLSSFSKIDIFKSSIGYTTRKRWLRDLNPILAQEKYVIDPLVANYSSYETNSILNFINIADFNTYVNYLALYNTGNLIEREVLPERIYQFGIDEVGVTINLPKFFYYAGIKYKFVWQMITGSQNYLTEATDGYTLYLDDQNYVPAALITLQYSVVQDSNARVMVAGSVATQKSIEIVPIEIILVNSANILAPYYVEVSTGVLENANIHFGSTRLLYWLFNSGSSSVKAITLDNYSSLHMKASDVGQYYLSIAGRNTVTVLNIPYEEVTSIKGLELFPNLKQLTINAGAVISLKPLENLSLTVFSYILRRSPDNFKVMDFSPLSSSKNTMTSFIYTDNGDANIEDMSFLLSFGTQLVTINLGGTSNKGYNNTMSYRYLVNYFAQNRPNTTIRYNNIVAVKGDSEEFKAMDILSRISTIDTDLQYLDNYILKFSNDIVQINGIKTARLMTYINLGGSYYPIKWTVHSTSIEVGSLTYHGSSFLAPFTLPRMIEENSTISYEELEILFKSKEFLQILVTNKGYFERNIALRSNESCYEGSLLCAKIKVGSYYYERMFTVKG